MGAATESSSEKWLVEIGPRNNLLDLNLKETWQYRDLLVLFVKRDVVTVYKQTVLGPLWYLIQPLLTSLIFTIVFNNVADIQTGAVSPFLFNLAGITIWNYFAACINGTSDTFKANEGIFGKVYFPRVIMPLSVIFSNLIRLAIQLVIFIVFYVWYASAGEAGSLGVALGLFPILILAMGLAGLGLGMMVSSLTTKYRDLVFLVQFGVQLLMYLSAVMYPIALAQEKLPAAIAAFVSYNPLAVVIEVFRSMVFYAGDGITLMNISFPLLASIGIFLVGLILFNRTEKNFLDTI